MTDLERFVARLVERLEARDPTGRYRPINIADLRTTIMPYRLNRSALGLSSHEDYELLVLRLVAEEGGFARTNPPESAARCREEASSTNPDLDIVEDLNDTTIQFGAAGLARVLGTWHSALGTRPAPAEAVEAPVPSPWAPEVVPEPPPPPPVAPEPAPIEAAAEPPPPEPPAEPPAERRVPSAECRELECRELECRECRRPLPTHRDITFCPYCGILVGQLRCGRCGADIEPGWRHCVSCGTAAGDR